MGLAPPSLPSSPDSQVQFRYPPSSLPATEMTGFSEALEQGRLPVSGGGAPIGGSIGGMMPGGMGGMAGGL